MRRSIVTIFAMLVAVVVFHNALGQSSNVVKVRSLQIDADARPGVGQFVPADDGVQHLAYELFVTSWHYTKELRFAAVYVEDAATGKRLAQLDSKALEDPFTLRITQYPGKAGPANRLLPAGRTAILTLDVKLPLGASVPSAVRHRIQFESDPNLQLIQDDGSLSSELISFSQPLPINRARPLVIGPPLRGGPWLCGNGFGPANSHGWIGAAEKIARMHVAQRFGCDFGKVDAEGNTLPNPFPNEITNKWFYGYGADVIAVADGRVVDTQDEIPENVPQADGRVITPVALTDRTFPGNRVALKIGEGQYAFYAHLQPGSLRVKVGDRVRMGQVLGKVGNSGNSVGPHLHFQVSDGPELNASDFVPHVYRSYWLSGHSHKGKPDSEKRRRIDFKVPTSGSFMTFPFK
jgi:murein DD-endopeptidase MepM/ murein hydrolase activator NlpD